LVVEFPYQGMKTKTHITLGAVLLTLAGSALARTWTSADGKNTFEGDFVSATETRVTVNRDNGSKISFDLVKLSDEDQEFVKEEAERVAATAAAAAESEKLKSAVIPKAISSKLVKLDGKRLKKSKLEVIPKYYFLAYSASW